ncbi:MAG: M15 family metallopeptidase [Burkholderiaceae bacterium]|nr:M15 family metallopeptidase [Burkholderiaceae bacterium]
MEIKTAALTGVLQRALLLCGMVFLFQPTLLAAEANRLLVCLANAYPDHLAQPSSSDAVYSHAGQRYPFDPKTSYRDFEDELERADLYSQMRQAYQSGPLSTTPQRNEDPGRLRHTPLFLDMYGKTFSEVASKLVTIHWAPCHCKLQFSGVNGAAQALEAVGQEIEHAGLSHFVAESMGTFNWRKIAGTQRLSMHAFGIAIDFKLPKALGRYWRWDGAYTNPSKRFPEDILRDKDFNRVVSIFESHGFVWGGKWWHYDSIHFEYRPELTSRQCGQTANPKQK